MKIKLDNKYAIITDEEAKEHFGELKYKPTGREFEVEDND